jgi:hypothetical protein
MYGFSLVIINKGLGIIPVKRSGERMGEELLGVIPVKEELSVVERFKIEKMLYERFKDDGIKVYLSIDSKKNAEEIKAETGIPEGRFLEILNFMEGERIIQLKTIFELEADSKLQP